jgi:hypothetical protein
LFILFCLLFFTYFLTGDVREVAPLEKAAREADAVLHIGFIAKFDESSDEDKNLINAFHRTLKGTNKRLVGIPPPTPSLFFSL